VDAIEAWHSLLRPDVELTPAFCTAFAASMRERKLTFGDRVHCPFLRPFFLTERDEARMRVAAETIAELGERVVAAALESPAVFDQLGVTEAEERLVRIDPGYTTASTASRVDAFLLPDSLQCAEYNAESPAGLAYTQRLCELFDALPVMARFRERRAVRFNRTIEPILDALVASYRDWGGRAAAPVTAIVDFRNVPTWTEFEILRDAFTELGVPTLVCAPEELSFDGISLTAGGRRIDLVYRRVLTNDILAHPDACAALVAAYEAGAVCVANSFRCKLAHKKAFFAVLTSERNAHLFSPAQREVIRAHVPWTRLLADARTEKDGRTADLLPLVAQQREQLVLKPNDEYGGTGVLLGWETPAARWTEAVNTALADPPGTWIVQERIAIRREVFPMFDAAGEVTMRDMLVDFAPYLYRGKMTGYLTRLSATGLANVTSGGGQVPSFVVSA
jgi:circularly permuted ATPgrasp domain protein